MPARGSPPPRWHWLATAASHRSAVDDGDPELVLIHIDHSDRIIWNRALCIDRVLQHSLDVFVADVDAILWQLERTRLQDTPQSYSQGLQDLLPHDCLFT